MLSHQLGFSSIRTHKHSLAPHKIYIRTSLDYKSYRTELYIYLCNACSRQINYSNNPLAWCSSIAKAPSFYCVCVSKMCVTFSKHSFPPARIDCNFLVQLPNIQTFIYLQFSSINLELYIYFMNWITFECKIELKIHSTSLKCDLR